MSFFSQFPTRTYDANKDGVIDDVTDIFRYVDVDDKKIDDLISYQFYQIEDGERPDIVSQKLYGTPDYYWTFFIVNDSLKHGLEDWPMSNQEFDSFMYENFSKYSSAQLRITTEASQPVSFIDDIDDSQGLPTSDGKYRKQIVNDIITQIQSNNPDVFLPPSEPSAEPLNQNQINKYGKYSTQRSAGVGTTTGVISQLYYSGNNQSISVNKRQQLAGLLLDPAVVFIQNTETREIAKILNYDINTSQVVVYRNTVSKIDIENSGKNYIIPPKVVIASSTTGKTATASCALGYEGNIDIVEVLSIGGDYSSVPEVTLDEGPSESAVVQPNVTADGIITHLNLVSPGKGYCKKPLLSLLDPKEKDEYNAKAFIPSSYSLRLDTGAVAEWNPVIEYEYDVTVRFGGKKATFNLECFWNGDHNTYSFTEGGNPFPSANYVFKPSVVNRGSYDGSTASYTVTFEADIFVIYSPQGELYYSNDLSLIDSPTIEDVTSWYYGTDNINYQVPNQLSGLSATKNSFVNPNLSIISIEQGGSAQVEYDSQDSLILVTAYINEGYTVNEYNTFNGIRILGFNEVVYEDIGEDDYQNMFNVGSFLHSSTKAFLIKEKATLSFNELRLRLRSSDVTSLVPGLEVTSDDNALTSDTSENVISTFLSGRIIDNYFDLFYKTEEPTIFLKNDTSETASLSARIIQEDWISNLKAFTLVLQKARAENRIKTYVPFTTGTFSYKSPTSGVRVAADVLETGGVGVYIKPMSESYKVWDSWQKQDNQYNTINKALKYSSKIEYFDTWKISIQTTTTQTYKDDYSSSSRTATTNVNLRKRSRYVKEESSWRDELFIQGDNQWRDLYSDSFPPPVQGIREYYSMDQYSNDEGNENYIHNNLLGSIITSGGQFNTQLKGYISYHIGNFVSDLNPGFGMQVVPLQVTDPTNRYVHNSFIVVWQKTSGGETYYSTGGTGYTTNIQNAKVYTSIIDSNGNEKLDIVIPTITHNYSDPDNPVKTYSLTLSISIGPESLTSDTDPITYQTNSIKGITNGNFSNEVLELSNTDCVLAGIDFSGNTTLLDGRSIDERDNIPVYKLYTDLLSYLGTRNFIPLNGQTNGLWSPVGLLKYIDSDNSCFFKVTASGKKYTIYEVLYSLKTFVLNSDGTVGDEITSDIRYFTFSFDMGYTGTSTVQSPAILPPKEGFIRIAFFERKISEKTYEMPIETLFTDSFIRWLKDTQPVLFLDAVKNSLYDNVFNRALFNEYISENLIIEVNKVFPKTANVRIGYTDGKGKAIDQVAVSSVTEIEKDEIIYRNIVAAQGIVTSKDSSIISVNYPSPIADRPQFENLIPVTKYEEEQEKNNKRSIIRVVRPERIKDFVSKYRTLLNTD
jgi:hypothetical protein